MSKLRALPLVEVSNVAAIYGVTKRKKLARPLYEAGVSAGFPSPASDYIEKRLDLNEHLIKHEIATFFVRVSGDSMTGENIFAGDLLLVDRAEEMRNGHIIVARVENDFCVKKLRRVRGIVRLCSANPLFPDVVITAETDWEPWGRVMYSIRKH